MKTRFATMFSAVFFLAASAMAGGGGDIHNKQLRWSFDGVFGTFDKPSIQRGFQVYTEVCAACHGLTRIPFRQLQDVGAFFW